MPQADVSALRGAEFRRLEVKYLVDRSRRSGLERDLRAFMRPDAHAGDDGRYLVRSLYFDSPDYIAYHDKLAGVAYRHKLRARVYGDPATARIVRLEVKSRYLNFIHKTAVDMPREEYKAVFEALTRRVAPPRRLLDQSRELREFVRIQRIYNMEPKILVEYRRQAWERTEVSRTRVNFDDRLRATRDLDLLGTMPGARGVLRATHAIFEVKVDGVLPWWLHRLVAKYDLHAEAISKYCHAVRSEALLSARSRAAEFAA